MLMIQLGIQKEILVGISAHLVTLNGKVATQEGRVGKLEIDNAFKAGERKGVNSTVVAMWSIISALIAAGGISLLNHYLK